MTAPGRNGPAVNDSGQQNFVLNHSRTVLVSSVVTQQGLATELFCTGTRLAAATRAPVQKSRAPVSLICGVTRLARAG
jgi:hypothetical protein